MRPQTGLRSSTTDEGKPLHEVDIITTLKGLMPTRSLPISRPISFKIATTTLLILLLLLSRVVETHRHSTSEQRWGQARLDVRKLCACTLERNSPDISPNVNEYVDFKDFCIAGASRSLKGLLRSVGNCHGDGQSTGAHNRTTCAELLPVERMCICLLGTICA